MKIITDFIRFFSNKEILSIFIYLLAMFVVPGIATVAAVHLIVVALIKKKEWYFKSLVYFALLKHFNPIFHPPSTNLFLGFVMVLFVVFGVQILYREKIRFFPLERKFYLLLSIFMITSIMGSFYPEFSLIRLIIVWIFFFVVFQSIRRIGKLDILMFLVSLAIVMIVASSPLVFTGAGYLGNTGFFKGIINHSQDFALILLPLCMVYLMALLDRKVAFSVLHLLILSMGFFELVLSASRAAVGAAMIAFLVYFLFRKRKSINIKFLIAILVFLGVSIVFISMNSEKFMQKVTSFAIKYDNLDATNMGSEMLMTRAALLEVSINNFKEYPFTGIGFNVQTEYQDPLVVLHLQELIKYIPGTDIMYSRPLEKGNLYAGVFEESGLIGGIYFMYILFYLFFILYRSGYPWLWVPYLAMMLNFMGEASLFSPSGPGNFQFLLLVALYAASINKQKGST